MASSDGPTPALPSSSFNMSRLAEEIAAPLASVILDLILQLLNLKSTMLFKRRRLIRPNNTSISDGYGRPDLSLFPSPQSGTVLDLPELTIELILEHLSAPSVLQMRAVCRELRERCSTDCIWERLFLEKWGRIIGPAATRRWQQAGNSEEDAESGQLQPFFWPLARFRLPSWINSFFRDFIGSIDATEPKNPSSKSIMAWYAALETGKFKFPAQVYNRENRNIGFVLSCYDAELVYDRNLDTFTASYPPLGSESMLVEHGVGWERIRCPPTDTNAHDVHISDCLMELKPGDHVEVQWRRSRLFPYGWWYGIVGHSGTCGGDLDRCHCHAENIVWLEFNQYLRGSRWQHTPIDRRTHRESGSEAQGFYGGIRKLKSRNEIEIWQKHWPEEALE